MPVYMVNGTASASVHVPASWQDGVLTKRRARSGVAQMYCKNALKRACVLSEPGERGDFDGGALA